MKCHVIEVTVSMVLRGSLQEPVHSGFYCSFPFSTKDSSLAILLHLDMVLILEASSDYVFKNLECHASDYHLAHY